MEGNNVAVYPLVVTITVLAVMSPRDVRTTHRGSPGSLDDNLEILFTWVCVKRRNRLEGRRFATSAVT
jgi:hypothetical protein